MRTRHENAWKSWREALGGSRMHHAWLLAGKEGLGKAHFAVEAARELVGAHRDGPHPDILVLTHGPKDEKEENKRADGKPYELARSIRIGQIRAMQQRLITKPTLGERRAVIIDPADDLERNAANALLKSLEEPPIGTYFLLVTHSPARLLPTIRSRCRLLRFASLSDPEMTEWLQRASPGIDEATRKAAVAAAGGSPGRAQSFLKLGLGRASTLMERILAEGDESFILRGELADAIGARPDRERLQAIMAVGRGILAKRSTDLESDPRPLVDAHAEFVRLTGEAPTFNYDPGLLAMKIGTLLAGAAASSDRANG